MREYILELIETYVAGKLRMDFIYVGVYDYLRDAGLLPAVDSDDATKARIMAGIYYTAFTEKFQRGLGKVKGVEVYKVDFERRLQARNTRIENYTKKLLVYDLIASGKPIFLPKISDHADSNVPPS